jgi:hypothetical protein
MLKISQLSTLKKRYVNLLILITQTIWIASGPITVGSCDKHYDKYSLQGK